MGEDTTAAKRLDRPAETLDLRDWLRRRFNTGNGFPTPLAGMMACRWACLAMVIIALLQSLVVALDVRGWVCPLHAVTGIPCPGCGLSRACAALLHGQWIDALRYHAFAYGVPLVLCVLLTAAVTRGRLRTSLIRIVGHLERRTGVTTIAGVAFLLYYIGRLLLVPARFIAMIGC